MQEIVLELVINIHNAGIRVPLNYELWCFIGNSGLFIGILFSFSLLLNSPSRDLSP